MKEPSSPPCLLGQEAAIDPDYTQLEARPACLDFSLANTVIYCDRWLETVAFYRNVLGLQTCFRKDEWFVELVINAQAHLGLADASRCSIPAGHGTGLTLSLMTADLQALHQYLQEKGLAPGAIVDRSWREPFFYISDPEGTRIELWSPRSPDR